MDINLLAMKARADGYSLFIDRHPDTGFHVHDNYGASGFEYYRHNTATGCNRLLTVMVIAQGHYGPDAVLVRNYERGRRGETVTGGIPDKTITLSHFRENIGHMGLDEYFRQLPDIDLVRPEPVAGNTEHNPRQG
jgi:hypothetical protein